MNSFFLFFTIYRNFVISTVIKRWLCIKRQFFDRNIQFRNVNNQVLYVHPPRNVTAYLIHMWIKAWHRAVHSSCAAGNTYRFNNLLPEIPTCNVCQCVGFTSVLTWFHATWDLTFAQKQLDLLKQTSLPEKSRIFREYKISLSVLERTVHFWKEIRFSSGKYTEI